ncbi:HAMP domain-containing histidine kinase [Myxococcota bacterium]|nr:HAMP domain-containing histidine kinase [Myxococcota bacterium]
MPDARSPCILVVDDLQDNRDLLERRLARAGYRTRSVASAEDALAAVDGCDAVLLDIEMPGMGGLECLRRLRVHSVLDQLPVIMVTARERPEDVVACLHAGASDYVSKPIDFPVLAARLRTWLRLKELRETREHFMRVASHDLRNPLTRILSTVELVREMVAPGEVMTPELHHLLAGVGDAAQRMGRIIEDFVDLQAMQDGALSLDQERLDLDALLEPALERQAAWAREKGISLQVERRCGAWVLGDRDRLDQVLDNLIGNAVKFSRGGTTVRLRCQQAAGRVRVEVQDEGPGLEAQDLGLAFQRYARLSAKPTAGEASSGLGLSIAREIVEMHGGAVGVQNNDPPPGATFWFDLPLEPT